MTKKSIVKLKKTNNIQNEIVNNDLKTETISTKISKISQSTGEIKDSCKKEKKLLIKRASVKAVKIKQYDSQYSLIIFDSKSI